MSFPLKKRLRKKRGDFHHAFPILLKNVFVSYLPKRRLGRTAVSGCICSPGRGAEVQDGAIGHAVTPSNQNICSVTELGMRETDSPFTFCGQVKRLPPLAFCLTITVNMWFLGAYSSVERSKSRSKLISNISCEKFSQQRRRYTGPFADSTFTFAMAAYQLSARRTASAVISRCKALATAMRALSFSSSVPAAFKLLRAA